VLIPKKSVHTKNTGSKMEHNTEPKILVSGKPAWIHIVARLEGNDHYERIGTMGLNYMIEDRPNPIAWLAVEIEMVEDSAKSDIGIYPLLRIRDKNGLLIDPPPAARLLVALSPDLSVP
jgi:hypothetical protein